MPEDIQGLKVVFDADTSAFKKSLKEFDKDLKTTQNELKTLQNSLQLEFDPSNLAKAQKLAQKAIKDTDERANILRQRLKVLEDAGITDKNQAEYRRLQNELIKTEDRAKLLGKELEKLNNLKLDNLAKGFDEAGKKLDKVGKAIMPISVAAGTAVAGLAAAGLNAVKTADDIATTSTQLGMSAEALQEWQYIAMQTDVPVERLTKSFVALRGTIGEALIGQSNNATKAMEALGFTMDDMQSKTPEAMFEETIQALSSIEDDTLQAAYANQIFGEKVANDLIPLLKTGADGIKNLSDEFQTMGYMTNEQVEKLAEFDNVMNKIKTQFAMVVQQIGVAFLPVMQSVGDILTNNVLPVLQKFADWFGSLSEGQMKAIVGIGLVVAALGPLLIILGKVSSGIGSAITMFKNLSPALQSALGPIGIILGVLALLYSTNEQFRESINQLLEVLISSLMPIFQMLGEFLGQLLTVLQPVIDMLGTVLANAISQLMPFIGQLIELLMPLIQDIFSALIPIMMQLAEMQAQILTLLMPIINILFELLIPILNMLMPIIEILVTILGGIVEIISKLIGWVLNLAKGFIELLTKALKPVIDAFKSVWDIIKKLLGIDDDIDIDANINYNDPGYTPPDLTTNAATTDLGVQSTLKNTVASNAGQLNKYSTTNNVDNSQRNITVELTVNNYGSEMDEKELIERINYELAKNL